ncbi:MAG: hypothetical protein P1V51_08365 [Deltaproteobacteria bacterium]|nr:hypothetical protein [Deltaproteobacteria bacterium]
MHWRPLQLTLVLAGLLLSAACAHVRAGGRTLERGVAPRAGVVAFSPDGERLALVRGGDLVVLGLDGAVEQTLDGLGARQVDWSEVHGLLVIHEVEGEPRLSRIDPASGERTPLPLEGSPDGVRAWGERLAVVDAHLRPMRFGVVGGIDLISVDPAGPGRPRLSHSVSFPTREGDQDFLAGWLHAMPRPGVGSLAVALYKDPPAVPPSCLIVEVDPVAGEPRRLHEAPGQRFTLPLSFSADGGRLAYTDDAGALHLVDLKSGAVSPGPESPARGLAPTFGPRGRWLHLGGWLVDLSASTSRQLLRDAPEALGTFSPDGGHLAVVDARGLHLFTLARDPAPPLEPDAALAAKLATLRGLLRKNLITETDYLERRDGLLRAAGHLP